MIADERRSCDIPMEIRAVLDYMDSHCSDPLCMAELAATARMNVADFESCAVASQTAGTQSRQTPLCVAVYMPERGMGNLEIARDFFGSYTAMLQKRESLTMLLKHGTTRSFGAV